MIKISNILQEAAGRRPVFSFEFFPPKNEEGEQRLYSTIEDLKVLKPDYVSVTYGAGGSTREKTVEWVRQIQDRYGILSMAHFTCVGASRAQLRENLSTFYNAGIRNIMALRGDPPRGESQFQPAPDGFAHASDLIAFIKESGYDFSIGAAAYPEKHLEARSLEKDMEYLKRKVDAGAEFLVTQLFFDNDVYFEFLDRCERLQIRVPVIPGIMPITHFKQVEKFTQMAGCTIPRDLRERIERAGDNQEMLMRESMDFSVRQVDELLKGGAPGIHFYTLNQSRATMEILKRLRGI